MKIDSIKQWFYENNSYINNSKDNILLNKLLYCSQYIIYNLIKSQHILKDNDYNNILSFVNNIYEYINFITNFDEENLLEMYNIYVNNDTKKTVKIINNICYFIDNNINLSEKEMNDIVLTYNENNSYYIFKDNEGTTVIY